MLGIVSNGTFHSCDDTNTVAVVHTFCHIFWKPVSILKLNKYVEETVNIHYYIQYFSTLQWTPSGIHINISNCCCYYKILKYY